MPCSPVHVPSRRRARRTIWTLSRPPSAPPRGAWAGGAVSRGARAGQAQGALHHRDVKPLDFGDLAWVVGVEQVAEVKVAVTHVADDPVRNARGFGFLDRLVDAFGQTGDGHAGIGALAAAPRAGLQRREIGFVPRGPQPR